MPRPSSLGAWILALRPATLPAAVVPVVVGAAVAYAAGSRRVVPILAALSGALLLQILANLANDVFDFQRGADTSERLGPTRAVQAGLLTPDAVRGGIAIVIALALAVGVYLTVVAGPWIVVIGVAAILSALAYTGGPYPIGYHGLGEVFVILFFGFAAVTGTAFVALGRVTPLALLASIPPGALASAVLVVNNLRDRETDIGAGKRTLAVRWGARAAMHEYAVFMATAYAMPIALWTLGFAQAGVLLPLATLPLAGVRVREVYRGRGRALNQSLVKTALLLLGFGLLFATGIALGGTGAS
ncbi:MAG: 1,4-dihydroxy-2-naphthoate polyprenyltransferase [Polyangiaceae bacterium]|nr:1,4-dihydroxy-2-naphthoate polyprenyltransferase [Polyangiaceae bacterium]